MILIFKDRELKSKISGDTLLENKSYYLRLKEHDPEKIHHEVESSRLASLYEWYPENKIGKISLNQIVGNVSIFGLDFDVKSQKFLTSNTGEDQYEIILKDLAKISQGIVFTNVSESTAKYEHSLKATSNIFFKFNYLISIFLGSHRLLRPDYYFQLITHNPHIKQTKSFKNIAVHKLKKISRQTIQKFITQPQFLEALPEGHPFSNYELTKFLSDMPGKQKLFPTNAYSLAPEQSLDTAENRFIKYFFEDVQSISIYIKNNYKKHPHLAKQADKLLEKSGKILYNPFFKPVGRSSYPVLSGSSTILNNRSGYKEIYQYYLKSRLAPKSFFEHIKSHLKFLDVKNIAILYEYWCFISLVKQLIPNECVFNYLENIVTDNGIKPSGVIAKSNIKIYYNKTYSNSSLQSYALNFRPDITVEISNNEKTEKYIFDAKYRNRELTFNNDYDENLVVHKNDDIAKMLSYMESIKNAKAAFIIYPGDRFIFYNKQFSKNNTTNDINRISSFSGVGALPLSPGNKNSHEIFNAFFTKFKNTLQLF